MITCVGTLSQRRWDPQYRNEVRTKYDTNETLSNLPHKSILTCHHQNQSVQADEQSLKASTFRMRTASACQMGQNIQLVSQPAEFLT